MIKLILVTLSLIVLEISGHGMMLDPPNRSSLWRFDEDAPPNYEDNQNFCGGFEVQWSQNGGRCGVCGDAYQSPHPQLNENTGKYGQGKVVANYTSGQVIDISILITANHLGFFEYHLCELHQPDTYEAGEECFEPLLFEDGTSQYPIGGNAYKVKNRVKLPEGFTCERCVLRWHYTCGNNVDTCEDGEARPGCGAQETFRSCADIAII